MHPDGSAAVVAVRTIDSDADDYTSQLWLVPSDGSPSRQLTYAWRDTAPVYSPDGRWVAFVRSERDGAGKVDKPQNEHMPDLNWREIGLLVPLFACIIWLGVYPAPVLRRMEASAEKVVRTVQTNAALSESQTAALPGGE